jgi:hypothetical protein
VADLTAIGPESHQRWRNPLPEGQVIRIGRAPRTGWKVWWDSAISREHADVSWSDGTLRVQRLEMARNPVVVNGAVGDTFELRVGDSFCIGQTRFVISDTPVESGTNLPKFLLDRIPSKGTTSSTRGDGWNPLDALLRTYKHYRT